MNFNMRNIVGIVLLLAGIALYVIQTVKGVSNWYELIMGGVLVLLSFIAFDFITVKAIQETFQNVKNKKSEQDKNESSK